MLASKGGGRHSGRAKEKFNCLQFSCSHVSLSLNAWETNNDQLTDSLLGRQNRIVFFKSCLYSFIQWMDFSSWRLMGLLEKKLPKKPELADFLCGQWSLLCSPSQWARGHHTTPHISSPWSRTRMHHGVNKWGAKKALVRFLCLYTALSVENECRKVLCKDSFSIRSLSSHLYSQDISKKNPFSVLKKTTHFL